MEEDPGPSAQCTSTQKPINFPAHCTQSQHAYVMLMDPAHFGCLPWSGPLQSTGCSMSWHRCVATVVEGSFQGCGLAMVAGMHWPPFW